MRRIIKTGGIKAIALIPETFCLFSDEIQTEKTNQEYPIKQRPVYINKLDNKVYINIPSVDSSSKNPADNNIIDKGKNNKLNLALLLFVLKYKSQNNAEA